MAIGWCIFFQGLIASVIGAFVGVLLGIWVDRWRQQRRKKEEARKAGNAIIEEIDSNITVLQTLIDILEWMRQQAQKRLLKSSDFAKPFARLQSRANKYALERDLLQYLWEKKVTPVAEIQLRLYADNCDGINIGLQRFEDFVSHLLLPLPDPSDQSMWMLTLDDLLPRISERIQQLRSFMDSSRMTYDWFEAATGLKGVIESK